MMVLRVVFAHGAAVSIFKLRRHSLVKEMEAYWFHVSVPTLKR